MYRRVLQLIIFIVKLIKLVSVFLIGNQIYFIVSVYNDSLSYLYLLLGVSVQILEDSVTYSADYQD